MRVNSSNQPARAQWEADIIDRIEGQGITRSDAQAIFDGQERAANVAWCLDETAAVAAQRILKASEAGADLSPQDALELARGGMPDPGHQPEAGADAKRVMGRVIAHADKYLSDVGRLPTYSELLAALREIEAALADHPQASQGNSKVHFALHKARGALRT